MKRLVSNYAFSAATQQVTLPDYTALSLESLLLITNVTDNIIIYNFASPGKGATISGNVLTLSYDTTSMSDTDDLQIFIDDGNSPSTEATLASLESNIQTMAAVFSQLMGSIGQVYPDTGGRIRAITDTTSSINNVTNLSNQTQIGSFQAADTIPAALNNLYQSGIRKQIIVS
jgi:hypothetical protein